MPEEPLDLLKYLKSYAGYLLKWLLIAGVTGALCGLVGALFYNGVAKATELREENPFLLYLLPAAGLLIVYCYRTLKQEGNNTDTVIEAAREGTRLRIELLPSIFLGTILTHLCGGSSGREGAALQIGGDIGNHIGALFRLDRDEMRVATMAGMAAFFSAIFGTPLTAAVFVMLFINVGSYMEMAFLPCYIASLIAIWLSEMFGVVPFRFPLEVPPLLAHHFLRVMVLAALAGLVSVLFVQVLHTTDHLYKRFFANPYIRVVAGALIVIALTKITGTTDYNGAGGGIIRAAVVDGQARPEAFLLKILFTALTLEAGFKGGEIVPTFFIGATFGCAVGPLLGIPAAFGAAIGLVAAFAGATNTVLASVFLAIEVFGADGILFFALGCIVSYVVSGYNGLYSSQRIIYSKVRPARIDLTTNHNHLRKHLREKR